MAKWLTEEIGKEYLIREYVEGKKSALKIAGELGTYALSVIRALKKHGIAVRGRSEARNASLRIGDSVPFMLGRTQPEAVRNRIRESTLARLRREREQGNRQDPDQDPDLREDGNGEGDEINDTDTNTD